MTQEESLAARMRWVDGFKGRRLERKLSMDYLEIAVDFTTVARNLRDDESFNIWIEKLFSVDAGMTVRYMTKYHSNFGESRLQRYNQLLRARKMGKYQIPVQHGGV